MKRLGFLLTKYITYEFSDENRNFFVIFEAKQTNKLHKGFLVINGISKLSAFKSKANYDDAIDMYKQYIENQKQKIIKNELL
jgi:hypothetical protein